MAQGFGYEAFVGVGRESTWGTRVAPTVFQRIKEESMKLNQSQVTVPTLGHVSAFRSLPSRRFVDGGFKFDAGFNGMLGLLLADALGASSSVDAQVAATSAYTHTMTAKNDTPVGLSVQCSRDAAAIGTAYDYEGCIVESLTLRQGNEAFLECDVTFQGQEETKQTEATESFASFYGIDYTMFSLTLGGVAQNVKEFEVTISNTLATDRGLLGSRLRPEIGRSGLREVSGSMLVEFDAVTEYDLYRDLTESAIVATWAAPASSIESGQAYDLAITMSQSYVEGPDIGVKDHGPLMLPLDFKAISTVAGNDDISLILKNTDTAII